jgi:uncharacterized protein YaeQ
MVDAAQLGQWVGGIDPRNIPLREKPLTHFVNSSGSTVLTLDDLKKIKFDFNYSDGTLLISHNSKQPMNLYNLHLHSKIHRWIFSSNPPVKRLIDVANKEKPVSILEARKIHLIHHLKEILKYIFKNPEVIFLTIKRRIICYFGLRPSSYPMITGDTFRKFANHIWEDNNTNIKKSDVKNGDIIFCQSEMIESLSDKVLRNIQASVVIILGNSDKNHSKELEKIIDINRIKGIFAQNLTEPIAATYPIPIGLENAWRVQNGRKSNFDIEKKITSEKVFRVMWTFNIETNLEIRQQAAAHLVNIKVADHLHYIKPKDHARSLKKYAFVASPPGNGLDTHRTWEALYLNCVPIVLRSHMTEEFYSYGLPLWIVDSYKELESLDEIKLEKRYKEISHKFKSEAIWMDYWIRKIDHVAKYGC